MLRSITTFGVSMSSHPHRAINAATIPLPALAASVQVGDVVFIRVTARPFREVAAATASWTNHVGVVIDTGGPEPLIGESTFPLSGTTSLSRFIARSEDGRVTVQRLRTPPSTAAAQRIRAAAQRRLGVFYDTGFNLHSPRQFCSRFVREVLQEATGVTLGEVETFGSLLAQQPQTELGFWRLWYFGRIPWTRETVTPASLLRSRELAPVFDGVARRS
jgi:cell wall-associated NlpC family hydrolase